MKNKYATILCFILGILWGFGFGCLIKNKKIYELEHINNQLKLEYDELKIHCQEIGWELHSCYYTLDKTEEYCYVN